MARVGLRGLKSVSLVWLNRRLRRRLIRKALIRAAIKARRAAITIPMIAPLDIPPVWLSGGRVGEIIVPLVVVAVVEEVVVGRTGSELVVVVV